VQLYAYPTPRPKAGEPAPLHPFVRHVQRAGTVARAAAQLRGRNFVPALIYAQIGWGEAIFLKDIFPESKLVLYCEFFYGAEGGDTGFDKEFEPRRAPEARRMHARLMNVHLLMAIEAADAGIAPTHWQRSRFPAIYQDKISVVHDGIDTAKALPSAGAVFQLPGKDRSFKAGDPLVTYVARNLEPYRGFHIFMRAVPEILARNPAANIVIVGGDAISYSSRLPPGQTYRARALKEVGSKLDPARVHFIPSLPYEQYIALLQVSAAHVYLTYPFVLSWSLLEAMAAECLVIASRTAPVEEVVRDGENALLFDFFSPAEIAERVTLALEKKEQFAALRKAARRTIQERFDLREKCLPQQLALLEKLVTG
jgi:glycosyltransferase involved in cell wall biosynthesis